MLRGRLEGSNHADCKICAASLVFAYVFWISEKSMLNILLAYQQGLFPTRVHGELLIGVGGEQCNIQVTV